MPDLPDNPENICEPADMLVYGRTQMSARPDMQT